MFGVNLDMYDKAVRRRSSTWDDGGTWHVSPSHLTAPSIALRRMTISGRGHRCGLCRI